MKWIGRVLCRLGWHKLKLVPLSDPNYDRPGYNTLRCQRPDCGRYFERVDPLEFHRFGS